MSNGKWWMSALASVAALVLAGYTVSTNDDTTDNSHLSASETSSTRATSQAKNSAKPTPPTTSSHKNQTSQKNAKKGAVEECGTLPEEAEDVLEDIERGGPFDYPSNDGTHFGNYERRLPAQSSNYYREYTVTTPGIRHRGERRIITGGGTERDPQVWYYTDDHYDSFCEIPDPDD